MRKNWQIIVGLGLPLLLVVIVVIAVFIPGMFVDPQYDFVYSDAPEKNYYGIGNFGYSYGVDDKGEFFFKYTPCESITNSSVRTECERFGVIQKPKFYQYSTSTGLVKEVKPEDMVGKKLSAPFSPDGYTINRSYGNDGIFEIFGSRRDYNSVYARKGSASTRIELPLLNNSYYGNGFNFVGWIVE